MLIKTTQFCGHTTKKVTLYVNVKKNKKKYSAEYTFSYSNGGGAGDISHWWQVEKAIELYGIKKAIKIENSLECHFLIYLLFNKSI